jgi:uncharacterized protein YndB with AHSA1/START domain
MTSLIQRLAIATALAAWAAAAQAADTGDVATVQSTAADGTRFYEDSIVINAPARTLWQAFTDTKTYQRWGAAVSAVDFRLGGAIEASYDPKGHLGDPDNIKNAFIAYLPERLLVFQNVQAPAALPGREAYARTVKVVEFDALGSNLTRVTISGVGFGPGQDFDQLLAFFSKGDGEVLKILKAKFEAK